jgi:hypothetical protein
MKRSISFTTAILAAWLVLLLLTSVVHSGPLTDRLGQDPAPAAIHPERARLITGFQAEPSGIQSTSEYSLTRIVTVTVGSSTVPLTPGLNSHWQIDILGQQFLTGTISLPSDASAINVTVVNGEYSIDYSGPTIYISNSQGLNYEYLTDQQALRFGNQILISQIYRYNRPLHYVGTVVFTDPYQYVGVAGYVPTQVNATELHWDASFTRTELNTFEANTWLVHPEITTKPDLEIITATLFNQTNHVHVAATIRNGGFMPAGAPAYLNLYDRLAPSVLPTGPLDLADGWCSLSPFSLCGGGASNPLPAILPGQAVIFTAEIELTASGRHDIYLFVDALGSSQGLNSNQGLNVESVEDNNFRLVGSTIKWETFVFLPVIKRG